MALAMLCKKGGQVLARNEALKHEWRTLCGHALGCVNIFDKLTLKTCQDVRAAGEREGCVLGKDLRGEVGAHNFWKVRCCAIFNVRLTDTGSPLQQGIDPKSCLVHHKKGKKQVYLQHCLDRNRSFTPFVFSVDRIFSTECAAAVKWLVLFLLETWSWK